MVRVRCVVEGGWWDRCKRLTQGIGEAGMCWRFTANGVQESMVLPD